MWATKPGLAIQATPQQLEAAGPFCPQPRCGLRSSPNTARVSLIEQEDIHPGVEHGEPFVLFPQLLGFLRKIINKTPVERHQSGKVETHSGTAMGREVVEFEKITIAIVRGERKQEQETTGGTC